MEIVKESVDVTVKVLQKYNWFFVSESASASWKDGFLGSFTRFLLLCEIGLRDGDVILVRGNRQSQRPRLNLMLALQSLGYLRPQLSQSCPLQFHIPLQIHQSSSDSEFLSHLESRFRALFRSLDVIFTKRIPTSRPPPLALSTTVFILRNLIKTRS